MKLLIENGADIDEMDNINCSALKKAALRGNSATQNARKMEIILNEILHRTLDCGKMVP